MKKFVTAWVVYVVIMLIFSIVIAIATTDWLVNDSAHDVGNWVKDFKEAQK